MSKFLKKPDIKPYIIGESEHYAIIGGFGYHSSKEALETAEYLRECGYKPLTLGGHGGVFCEKTKKASLQ